MVTATAINKAIGNIQAGVSYWNGISSSPELIHVTDLDAKGMVTYYRGSIYANSQPQRAHINTMKHSINKGTKTRIKQLEDYLESNFCKNQEVVTNNTTQRINELKNALAGKGEVKPINEHYRYAIWVHFDTPQNRTIWNTINDIMDYSACDGCSIDYSWFECHVIGKTRLEDFKELIGKHFPEATFTVVRPKR